MSAPAALLRRSPPYSAPHSRKLWRAGDPMDESRVCIKGLPKHVTVERLRGLFGGGEGGVTDCQIVKTSDGRSRQLAFVGFATPEGAKRAVERFDKTFVDTSRVTVELARGVGDARLQRPWSKHSVGSSRYVGKPGSAVEATGDGAAARTLGSGRKGKRSGDEEERERERDAKFEEFLKMVKPSEKRRHMPWENAEEEEEAKAGGEGPEAPGDQDDAAWLRAKQGLNVMEGADEEGGDKSKKRKKSKLEDAQDAAALVEEEDLLLAVGGTSHARQAEATAKVAETRRLFVRNLPPPGALDEGALRKHLEGAAGGEKGAVVEFKLPLSKKTQQHKGYCLVTYATPPQALQAYARLDGQIFAGKLLHAVAADAARDEEGGTGVTSNSFKRNRDLQRKKHEGSFGSALFVNTDAAAQLTAAKLGIAKADLLSSSAHGSVAVRATLAEAEVLAEAKEVLQKAGVVLDVLANTGVATTRSDSVFLVKNLAAGTLTEHLEQHYAPFGDLGRVMVVPGGALGLVEFLRPADAQKAYRLTALSNFRGSPLYLQWAPVSVFSRPFDAASDGGAKRAPTASNKQEQQQQQRPRAEDFREPVEEAGEVEEGDGPVSVFVKNLSFQTSREELASTVGTGDHVRSVTIVQKNGMSLGYGFIELANRAAAVKVMKQLQGYKLDGHALELSFAQRPEAAGEKKKRRKRSGKQAAREAEASNKLVVRNVPFEASKQELQTLMGAYGAIKSLRLPLKFDRSHRGYAFAEYQSIAEARKALEALESAHLYGRHLVVEYAREEDDLEDLREKTARKSKADQQL